ncbi:MAG: hypothetical protein OK474_06430 [Thaumarchaeota archaeon]|nr:hypothetical protein [Nitrososphaerota archaeon]
MGKNGREYSLTYGENYVIGSLLTLLLKDGIDFGNASEDECKWWASALKGNIDRMRFLDVEDEFGLKGTFGLIEGMDIPQLFSTGLYADRGRRISRSNLEKAVPQPPNEYWRDSIGEFADFLDSCSGLVQLSPNAYRFPEN